MSFLEASRPRTRGPTGSEARGPITAGPNGPSRAGCNHHDGPVTLDRCRPNGGASVRSEWTEAPSRVSSHVSESNQ